MNEAGTERTVLIGGGGHARSILEMAEAVAGYVDCQRVDAMEPLAWLGEDESFKAGYAPTDVRVHIAVVGGDGKSMALRRRIIDAFSGYEKATLTASSAVVTRSSRIGSGSAIMHGAVINGAEIGENCVINTGAVVEHECSIGDNVFVGPGAVVCGGVTIGDDTFIGAGATIRNGVSICGGVTVGCGAVVVADIAAPGVYIGVPAIKKQ